MKTKANIYWTLIVPIYLLADWSNTSLITSILFAIIALIWFDYRTNKILEKIEKEGIIKEINR